MRHAEAQASSQLRLQFSPLRLKAPPSAPCINLPITKMDITPAHLIMLWTTAPCLLSNNLYRPHLQYQPMQVPG
ncbi:hypothetical protein GDO81_016029 [Engystomops pustulosus]|uniref:Uncharacterized protein n=1 Tax=Engystomops pustulosus TaxID=76066 RepID=A0AAV7AUX5_ENGPU|nr:hypothetical protein GDO81_016029 [Engystomops pustulosus]